MYGEFIWWQGVVEDRYDPLKLGRCRVRILGYHTDNKQEGVGIPTADLPWATPMQPITSAAMNGIGTSPTGVVEGTWVFGFFRDGKNAQEPVIMGTFGGIPEDKCTPGLGFNDPTGKYPLQQNLNESDTNRLARGSGAAFPLPTPITDSEQLKDKLKYPPTAEDAPSLIHKRETRQKDTPTARAGDMSTSIDNTSKTVLYTETLWNEPNPRYGGTDDLDTVYLDSVMHSSAYPRNHVRMSEVGHVEEWDDTPSVERLHRYHSSGTFEEIQPDGTKVTKIVGNEYEITLTDKKVLINGTCEVTVGKDCRMLYKGDLVQEVQGDYHLHVHGDKRTKIHGNSVTEILADRKVSIGKEGAGNDELLVNLQQMITVNGDRTISLGAKLNELVAGPARKFYLSTLITTTVDNNTTISNKNIAISAMENVGISADTDMNINVVGAFNKKISGVAKEEYEDVYHERHEGVYKLYVGDDTHTKKIGNKTDYTCPTSPARAVVSNTCEIAEEV